MAPIGNAMMIMYLSRRARRVDGGESVTIDVLIWRNREGDDSGFTSSSLVSDVNLRCCGMTIRDRTEPDHPPTNQLITGSRHLPSYSRVLRPKLPPLLLASIRRWSSTILIAATWWILERNEGENDSRAKNSCLRLVHRKWQKTRDRVTALRRTVTPQTLSGFVYDSRGDGSRAIGLQ